MKLHVFNPEHDMALAAGTRNYTPPANIRRMAESLAWLPSLWCEAGDVVLGKDVGWGDVALLDGLTAVEPWGWDAAIRHRLLKAGVPATLLPGDEYIDDVRRLSSRRTAVTALGCMRGDGLCGESHWCSSVDEARRIAEAMPAAMLKMPWSSSGKGLLAVHGAMDGRQMGWLGNVIARQGGVAVERMCDKAADCALEYEVAECRDGGGREVRYLGLSVFENSGTGAYAGNILGSEDEKMARARLDRAILNRIVAMHTDFIRRVIAPRYVGLLGIDMMVCRDGSVNPCVEINLRRTMGHVALLSPTLRAQTSGVFRLDVLTGRSR